MGHSLHKRKTTTLDPGLYNLILFLKKSKAIRIGDLGEFFFPKGFYVYTGSAMRGLRRRVARHQKRHKPKRWHIDYLRAHCSLVEVKTYLTHRRLECQLNSRIFSLKGAQVLVPKLGSSDCRCKTHLAWFAENDYQSIKEELLELKIGAVGWSPHPDDDLEKEENSL
jgi:sugar fermentation stimulation protein A